MISALREWWGHRNDPPAMIPDPVTREVFQWGTDQQVKHLVDRFTEEGWTLEDWTSGERGTSLATRRHRLVFRRYDGQMFHEQTRMGY